MPGRMSSSQRADAAEVMGKGFLKGVMVGRESFGLDAELLDQAHIGARLLERERGQCIGR